MAYGRESCLTRTIYQKVPMKSKVAKRETAFILPGLFPSQFYLFVRRWRRNLAERASPYEALGGAISVLSSQVHLRKDLPVSGAVYSSHAKYRG